MRTIALTVLIASLSTPLVAQNPPPSRGEPTVSFVSGPEVGDLAPEFTLPWATKDSIGPADGPFRLGHLRGKVVVLAFYPRDFTSGCTAELRTFTDQYDLLFGEGVEVVGISVDSLETHVSFASSLKLPFRLLSDPAQAVARRYGSNGSQGSMKRTVYVIDREGRVAYRDLRFGPLDRRSYDELKAAIRAIRGA